VTESFKRHFLKDKEIRQLQAELQQKIKIDLQELLGANPHLEFAESKSAKIYLFNDKPLFARKDSMILPTLAFDGITRFFPLIVVNMGAVPHVCNGADVMAPGIVAVKGDFRKDDFVVVVDERHQKPLAVGMALYDSETLKNLKQGKTIKNVHWVGDGLWQLLKKL
jgi:PUA domain protein